MRVFELINEVKNKRYKKEAIDIVHSTVKGGVKITYKEVWEHLVSGKGRHIMPLKKYLEKNKYIEPYPPRNTWKGITKTDYRLFYESYVTQNYYSLNSRVIYLSELNKEKLHASLGLSLVDMTTFAYGKGEDIELLFNTVENTSNNLKAAKYYVYLLKHDGMVVYIGFTKNWKNRYRQHSRGKFFDQIQVKSVKNKCCAELIELILLSRFSTKYNTCSGKLCKESQAILYNLLQ